MSRDAIAQRSILSVIRALGTVGSRDYTVNTAGDLVVMALGLASSILIARGLGPEGRGQLAAALLWPTTVAAGISLGLPHAFAYAAGARWASPYRLARFGAAFAVGVGVPAAVAYGVVAPRVLSGAFPLMPSAIRAFGCFIPLTLCAGLWMALYQGKGDFVTWTLLKFLRSAGYASWIAIGLLLGVATVPMVLWSQVALVVLALSIMWQRMPRISADDPPDAVPVPRLFSYGLKVYASGFFYMLSQQLDQLLLSLWVPAQELGQYASAAGLSAIVLFLPGAMGPVVFSRLARSNSEGGSRHALKAIAICGAVLLPTGLLLTLLAPTLVHLIYGAAFAPAGQLLRVLMPAAILLGFGNLFSDILRGSGRPLIPTYAMLIGLAVTIPGLAFALPRWGIWGAAWVSLFAYGAMLAVQAASFAVVSARWKLRG